MQLQVRHQLSSSANERVKTVLSIDLSTRQQPSSHSITQRSRAGCSAAPACFLEQMKRWGDGSPPASLGPQPTRWACWHGFALGVTQRVRDAVCSFPPGFLHSNSRWQVGNILLFATTTGIVLWASRLHPWEEPLPTAVPAEPPRPSPCTPPAASRGARATPHPSPVTPVSPFLWEISREVWDVVLNYNMRIRKWKKESFLSQSRTEKILRYAKEIRRRAVYSLGGTRPAFEADKSLLVIQYLNQN